MLANNLKKWKRSNYYDHSRENTKQDRQHRHKLHICDLQLAGNRLPPSIAVIDAALVERVCVKGWRGRENFLPTQDLLSDSCSRKLESALSGGRLMEKGLGCRELSGLGLSTTCSSLVENR
jgi:hypothetical protein